MNALLGERRGAIWAAGCVLLMIVLFLPAWINRQPVLYPDSVGYFHAGYAAAKQVKHEADIHVRHRPAATAPVLTRQQSEGVATARSVYYGAIFVAGYVLGGVWALALGQVLLTLACLVLAGRRAIALAPLPLMGALCAIALLTGLNIFAVTAMPDVFAGLMLLSMVMLLVHGRELPRWENAFWLAVVLLACLFHKAHLAILALTLAASLLLPFVRREGLRAFLLLAGAGLVALGGHYAVDLAVRQATGKWPVSTPFALARMVGDGTAEQYLRDVCPTRHFATCAYVSRMPMTENDFLWSHDPDVGVMGVAPAETRAAIAGEANAIVLGTLTAYPLEQVAATTRNVMTQLGDVGVREYRLLPTDTIATIPMLRWALDRYAASGIAQGWFPLDEISILMRAVYFAALIGIGTLLWRRRGGPVLASAEVRLTLLLLAGIVANAIISGAVAGVFDRYQGRIVWLAPFGFAVLLAMMLKEKRPENNALKSR
ncbi:MAG TPA: hypothetical protein VGM68_08690 [Rhizomicrobium sp.]